MRNLFKKILIGLVLIALPIIGYSQNHSVDRKPIGSIGSEMFKFKHLNIGVSMDSIHVSSSEILSGDSITMLYGNKETLIKWVRIAYTPVTTPYTTSGSTDSTKIMCKSDNGSEMVAFISDQMYDETLSPRNGTSISSVSMTDSCRCWLDIPNPKYTLGDGYYTIYYKYELKLE